MENVLFSASAPANITKKEVKLFHDPENENATAYSLPIPVETLLPPSIDAGKLATYNQFPYYASIFATHDRHVGIMCGGAFITTSAVLTAASCLYDNAGHLYAEARVMSAASADRFSPQNYASWVDLATHAKVHENYNQSDVYSVHNNIAIVFLGVAAFQVRPIRLQQSSPTINDAQLSSMYLMGFGRDPDNVPKQYLRYMTVQITPMTVCMAVYGPAVCGSDIITTFGLDSTSNSICRVESGAPLVYQHLLTHRLVGLAAFVNSGRNCVQGILDGYVSIPYHYQWITDNMDPQGTSVYYDYNDNVTTKRPKLPWWAMDF